MSKNINPGPVPMPRPKQITFTVQKDGMYFATWPDENNYNWGSHVCKNWGAALDLFIQALEPRD